MDPLPLLQCFQSEKQELQIQFENMLKPLHYIRLITDIYWRWDESCWTSLLLKTTRLLLNLYVRGSWFGQCIPFQGSPHEPRGPESSNKWPLVSTRGGSKCNTCDESKKEGTIPSLNHEDLLYLSLSLPQTSSKLQNSADTHEVTSLSSFMDGGCQVTGRVQVGPMLQQ